MDAGDPGTVEETASTELPTGVSIRGVSKAYGETLVLDDINLDITNGEFIVFLGPSGCGKSTLLRMIAGLESVTAGEIHIAGNRVDHLPPGRRDVAMVFQNYALYPHMTVRDNLSFGLRNRKTPKPIIEERISQAAQSLEITDYLDRKPGQLSGGQRQRVAIARAIVKEPQLFLFDEPLSNLDAALRQRTRLELAQLHRRLGATMAFVTHDQVEAMTLSDRIVLLNNQGIEQVGTPIEVYRRPATRFVATFVGSPRINLLPGTLTRGEDGLAAIKLKNGLVLQTPIDAAAIKGTDCELGIRPEFVRVAKDGETSLTCDVQVVERLGERTLLYGTLEKGTPIVAEDVGTSTIRGGDRTQVTLDMRNVHLFDANGTAYHPREAG